MRKERWLWMWHRRRARSHSKIGTNEERRRKWRSFTEKVGEDEGGRQRAWCPPRGCVGPSRRTCIESFLPPSAGHRVCGWRSSGSRGSRPREHRGSPSPVQHQPWLQILLLRDQFSGSKLVLPQPLQIHAGEVLFLLSAWWVWSGEGSRDVLGFLNRWGHSLLSLFFLLVTQGEVDHWSGKACHEPQLCGVRALLA